MTELNVTDKPAEKNEVGTMMALQAEYASLCHTMAGVLAYEAWLLDNDRLEQWLNLLADDLRYVAPVRRKIADERFDVLSIDKIGSIVSHFNDSKGELALRVMRLRTGHSHYDRPKALIRRVVGHPVILAFDEQAGEVRLASSFILSRAREEKEEAVLAGQREDIWRKQADASWLIARRLITLDHHFVPPLSMLL
jgi:3-phenylpropionate/cinnamic acid dioxygenase small subunit